MLQLWYNIIEDSKGIISDILRIDPITAGSILFNITLVALKRENPEHIVNIWSSYWIICYVVAAYSFASYEIPHFYAKCWSLYANVSMLPFKWSSFVL